MRNKLEEYKEICGKIYDCHKCSFYDVLRLHEVPFHPEYPLVCEDAVMRLGGYRIVTVGINPGWDKKLRNKNLQELGELFPGNFEQHYQEKRARGLYGGTGHYFKRISEVINLVNKKLQILKEGDVERDDKDSKEEIGSEAILKYALWCNLSCCNSPGTKGSRTFNGNIEVPCHVYSEERPKCLDQKFVEKYLKLFSPKLVIVLSSAKSLDRIDLLRKLDVGVLDSRAFEFQTHENGTKANLWAAHGKIGAITTKVLFVPHPNSSRFSRKGKESFLGCLSLACDFLVSPSNSAGL